MFEDIVYGKTGQNRSPNKLDLIDRVYDDPILIKSDGHPTYHLANVVDDHLMKITHEWMPSTPLHVALYNAFKWTPPRFGHVPLLVDKSGQKLSKRNADIDLTFFKDTQGVFAATLVNFAALLGWSHTQKSDIFSLEELEQILWFLQKAHAQRFATNGGPEFEEMVSRVSRAVEETCPSQQLYGPFDSTPLYPNAKSYTNASEFIQRNSTFFTTTLNRPPYAPAASASKSPSQTVPRAALHTAAAALSLVPEAHWTIESHKFNITSYDGASSILPEESDAGIHGSPEEVEKARVAADKTFKKELYHYLRWALSASAPGPGIPETMVILGRAESLRRLQEAQQMTVSLVNKSAGPTRVAKGAQSSENQDKTWMGSLAPKS
ncbi:unnamed protein product [Aspergillus oryzae]|nr:unnamed protein product [Aspergillus oryzae]GMF87537.1 unnamed protein product [Aspergillus oryzae]